MRCLWKYIFGVGILIASLGVLAAKAAKQDSSVTHEKPTLPLLEVQLFTDVFELVRNQYVESVDDATLIRMAIRGMLSGLDPHSAYLGQEEFSSLRMNASGAFGGIGVEVDSHEGLVRIIAPMEDTPAAKAGLLAGDLIFELDGKPVKDVPLEETMTLLRGEPGSSVQLGILRKGHLRPIYVTVIRANIKVASVRYRKLDHQLGYIRVNKFQENTAADVQKAVKHFEQEQVQGLLLDLRNNPGGVLEAAVEIADTFLQEGVIVSTRGRVSSSSMAYRAQAANTLALQLPMMVLINAGSASASEIVAGALQDHRRALVVGVPSFGKGSVQTVLPLRQDVALKLTTARYFTPSGRSIQAEGIAPDILLNQGRFSLSEQKHSDYKERDLTGHLTQDLTKNKSSKKSEQNKTAPAITKDDFQLMQALTILKGVVLTQRK